MIRIINSIIVLFVLLSSVRAWSQQDPNYTFYRYNMNIYNPAFAGSSEGVEFVLGLRSQWAGIEGAPESQSAIFGMPVGNKVGLGVSILNDKTFIETQTWMAVDFSYHIDLDEDNQLYFGLKASANSYDANTQGLLTYGVGQDGSLMNFESRFTPNVGAGIYLKNEKYFISLSAPKILTPDRLQEANGNAFLGADRMHAYLGGGYDFLLGGSTKLQALGMIRYVDASPLSYELTGLLDLAERFTLGAGYRYNESISGLFLFKVSNGFQLGYAYENAWQRPIDGLEQGTHEVFMRFLL
ncbi:MULTISPECIES: type IX secretion system membrane protein PorP/SprF [Maribacter]|uniref:Type IX secretion system membrane protein PorP/SprF n=2 Tax=Maribacter TaxID=252356 RepID=A0A5R8MC81_9FLAO|nr:MULTISPECIES: type IX secretion system membrane protein PorP/SprF [Maribacter]MDC6405173.1 type IX secretion system membrane protein PorP/SprF [Maribacter sp. PR66]MEE1972020.1 type IX secretion system membrane protein PorP/SprF [Maribacter flavus]TLF47135.1 type IX secretion system membrane protein PorP/SprF [Maribacter aurantiacus]